MLREDKRLIDGVHVGATGAFIAASYAALYPLLEGRQPPLAPARAYAPTVALLAALVMAALWQRRVGPVAPVGTAARWRELSLAYAFAVFAYGFAAYTLRMPHLSRLYVYGGLAVSYLLAGAWITAASAWHRRAGRERRRVLLVGEPGALGGVASLIAAQPALGLEVAGLVDPGQGGAAAVVRELDSSVVDFALFAGRRGELMEEAMLACRARGVELWLKVDLASRGLEFSRVDYLEEIPLLVCAGAPRQGAALLAKRAIDVVLAGAGLVAAAPALAAVAALVRISGPGPVLFRQRRIGLNGREFTLLKFRSMREGSPPDRPALRNEIKGPAFKMTDDPRVTPIGRFLRKFSLDELPQLWNVLVGEMSLVGPRPPLPGEVERYEVWHRRRLSMRPGITGLWQVMGRNAIPEFNEWVKLDLRYLDGWSLWLDLEIILRTVPVVLRGTGL